MNMKEQIILSTARKAILARIFKMGRSFSDYDINEMVSQTIERFYVKGHYDPGKSAIQTYVSKIASRVAYDYIKAFDNNRNRFVSIDIANDSESDDSNNVPSDRNILFADSRETDSYILRNEWEESIESAKCKLGERDRIIYDLICEEQSYSEIAQTIGTTANAVAVAVFRIKRQMRDNLAA